MYMPLTMWSITPPHLPSNSSILSHHSSWSTSRILFLTHWVSAASMWVGVEPSTAAQASYQGPYSRKKWTLPPQVDIKCQQVLSYRWDFLGSSPSHAGSFASLILRRSFCMQSLWFLLCNRAIVSGKHCFATVLYNLWLSQSFHHLFWDDHWALGRIVHNTDVQLRIGNPTVSYSLHSDPS